MGTFKNPPLRIGNLFCINTRIYTKIVEPILGGEYMGKYMGSDSCRHPQLAAGLGLSVYFSPASFSVEGGGKQQRDSGMKCGICLGVEIVGEARWLSRGPGFPVQPPSGYGTGYTLSARRRAVFLRFWRPGAAPLHGLQVAELQVVQA